MFDALNDKIRDLTPYDPIQGTYPIRLDANESFLPISNEILQEAHNAISQLAYHRYPDPYAVQTTAAFAAYYGIDAELVTAGNGSDELISVLMTAFLMKGERVLTFSHDFSMYRFYAALIEAQCIEVPKNADLTIDVDCVIHMAAEQRVRMILFSNPCNPTSLGLCREEVRRLITSVDALVVLDEAYMDFWDQSLLEEVLQYDNLIILRTCSKAFGMAAIRLGFAVANPTLTRAIRAVKSPYNVNAVTQAIGTAVLKKSQLLRDSIQTILSAKAALFAACKELEQQFPDRLHVYESCTNFIFVQTPDARQWYDFLLEHGVAVRCMGDYLRITAGADEENDMVTQLSKQFLNGKGES